MLGLFITGLIVYGLRSAICVHLANSMKTPVQDYIYDPSLGTIDNSENIDSFHGDL